MKKSRLLLSLALFLVFLMGLCSTALAADWPEDATDYTFKAKLMAGCPGVYTIRPTVPEGGNTTIGIPSIAKQNLENKPTTESPAIIMGAAVPYEIRKSGDVSPDMFQLIDPNKPVEAPYSYFRPAIVEEANTSASTDPTAKHYKMSGFDGTYVILRIDVTDLISNLPEDGGPYYLHVKQSGNKAMLVAAGEQTNLNFDADGNRQDGQTMSYGTFAAAQAAEQGSAALGSKSGSYSLADAAAALKSTDGADTETPYIDVVLLASGALVAGGDVNAADQGDVEISFYVDDQEYYPEDIPEEILAGNYTTEMSYAKAVELATAQQQQQQGSGSETTPAVTLEDLYLEKYFSANPANAKNTANYTLKGSDLALEVMMAGETSRQSDQATEYWSLDKALAHTYYDGANTDKTGAIIKLMSEVPVVTGLNLEGSTDDPKKRTLDVNTFDIQIADNTSGSGSTAGLTLKNAWLELMDSNTTTGSELAIGNNASMVVDEGGKLIIDEDGQLEVEYDAASQAQGQQTGEPINNGVLTIKPGGEIENNGVLTIEGTEAKEIDPTVGTSTQPTGKGQIINRGTLTNNGCISINGEFFNVGTLINNGKYAELIESNDPDKGKFSYHKGIQLSWKDDVTQSGSQTSDGTRIEIRPGILMNGIDPETSNFVTDATLTNNGDIVCAPGVIYNFGVFQNMEDSSVNLGVAVKAVVPVIPTAEQPTIVTKEIILEEPVESTFLNAYSWEEEKAAVAPAVVENDGTIITALVDVPNNGVLGEIHAPAYLGVSSYDGSTYLRSLVHFDNYGSFYLGSKGKLVLPIERNFNQDSTLVILNCDSVVTDETAHAGWIMTKSDTAGGEAALTQGDVTMAYTTFTTSGPAFTASPASVRSGETVTLSGTLSAWSADTVLTPESAPTLVVSGTGSNIDLSCSQVTNDGAFYTLDYSDSLTLSNVGTYVCTADVDGLGFITADASVDVQPRQSSGGASASTANLVNLPASISGEMIHGTVTSSAASARAGEKVNLTLTPDEGYQVADVNVTDAKGNAVPVTKNADGTYTFTMPASAVTVTPTFSENQKPDEPGDQACPRDESCPMTPFTDADKNEWYHDGVHWALETGVMNGTSENIFEPLTSTTRAMIVTMLWRMEGSPQTDGTITFTDVPDGQWYTDAIRWAAANDIVNGYDEETFGTSDTVTREQLATILYRSAKSKGQGFTGTWAFPLNFDDADQVSEWADEAMHWMTMNGIIQGMSDKELSPQGDAVRAQVATMLMRFSEKVS